MRRRYGWIILPAVLLLTLVMFWDEAVLASELPLGQAAATPSNATPSNATASNPDAESDEVTLLMDLPAGGCRTQEDLIERLLDDSQELIVLSSDIEWLEEDGIVVSGEKEVDMGEFHILVDRDRRFDVSGDVTFFGSGGNGALFQVRGGFCAGDGVKIRAAGDSAVAVELLDGDWASGQVEIYAAGTHARAVRFTGPRENTVSFCRIEAEGDGSRGIDSEGPLRLFLSSVRGEADAAVAKNGELTVFECALTPEPDQGELIEAMVVPFTRLEENGICIAAGSPLEELYEMIESYDTIMWRFFSLQTELAPLYMTSVSWSDIPVDVTRPGTWLARCTPEGVPEWFPAELYSLEVPIHVVDPERPFILDAQDAGAAAFLRFFAPVRDAKKIRVEYSVDDKKTWRDSAELPDSFVIEGMASLEPLEPGRDYWFRLVVEGGPMEGISNEILFVGDDVRKANGGGDRDHGDREDQGDLPPHGIIIPPPEDTAPDETQTSDTASEDTAPAETETEDTTPEGAQPSDTAPDGAQPGDTVPEGAKPGTPGPDGTENTNAKKTALDGSMPKQTGTSGTTRDGAQQDNAENDKTPLGGTEPDSHTLGTEKTLTSSAPAVSGSHKTSRMPRAGALAWLLIPCMILLGGGAYACWKKRREDN